MDADGYPEEDELETIRTWPWDHPLGWRGLFNYVKERWYMPEWGWHEEAGNSIRDEATTKLHISTAGWSGNEDIIGALRANTMFWMRCWEQSRRGGHFIFELEPPQSPRRDT